MGYQLLTGVSVERIGTLITTPNSCGGAVTVGKAFGGWVYNAHLELGFSQQPTSITLDIALDVQDGFYALNSADFLISKDDLNVRATALLSGESYYKITLGTSVYRPMFLVSYEINGSPDGKTLKVKFVDYSLILDKTRIAIFKRHDYKKNIPAGNPTAAAIAAASFFRKFSARPQINALCPGCSMEDSNFYDVVVNKQDANGAFEANTPPLVTQIESAAYFYNHKNKTGFDLYNTNGVGGSGDKLNGVIPATAQSFWPESLHILDESTRVPKVVTGTAVMSELYRTYYARTYNPAVNTGQVSSVRNSAAGLQTSYNGDKIDINGGTVVLGTEEFNESVCGSAAKVSYNFTELICILSKAGFNFSKKDSLLPMTFLDLNGPQTGAITTATINKNQNYRKDYSGTLREVLGNWCADFGLDFYVLGTRIHFIELSLGQNLECDIESIFNITKPEYVGIKIPTRVDAAGVTWAAGSRSTTVNLGRIFNSNTNYAIGNFTESADISDTYEQRIVTFRVKPKKVEEKTKEKKHHCGFLAMHPLDFLDPNMISRTDWRNIYSRDYTRPTIANVIWRATATTANKRYWYTNRSFEVIDRCAAIGKYSKDYRDIYAGQLICQDPAATAVFATNSATTNSSATYYTHGTTSYNHVLPNALAMEGFNSFAFMPLYKIGHKTAAGQPTNDDIKLAIIEKVFKKPNQAQQQYIIDHRTFDVWLGFRNEQQAEEIISWENSVAENMYKYGVMVRGSRDFFGPALPQTFSTKVDPATGSNFQNATGTGDQLFPNPLVYPRLNDPFVSNDFARQAHPSLGLDSGSLKLLKIENSSVPGFQRYRFYEDLPFRDLFKSIREYTAASISVATLPIASLDNDWGTSKEKFDADLRIINHASAGCANFGDAKIVTGPLTIAGTSGVNGVPLPASLSPTPYAVGAAPTVVAPTVGSDGSDRAPDSFSVSDFSPKFIDLPVSFFENVDFSGLKNAILNNPAAENLLGKLMVVQKESVTAAGVKSFSQSQCPRLQVMIIPKLSVDLPTDILLNPHLTIKFEYGRAENKVHERALYKNLYLQTIEKQKEFVKTKCDYSLSEIVCKVGKASTPLGNNPTAAVNCTNYSASYGTNCQCYSPINEIIASVYNIGFPKGTVLADGFEFPARKIKITINVHPRTTAYIPAAAPTGTSLKPLDSGGVGYLAADESYPTFVALTKVAEIIYPRQSDALSTLGVNNPASQNKLYQGILTQRSTFQLRNSETIECHGDQWFGDTNVSKVQMINNEVEQDIEQLLDSTGGLYSPVYDMRGNVIRTIKDYHQLIQSLSDPTKTGNSLPARTINLEIIGNIFNTAATNSIASNMGILAPYLTHERGLKSLSFSLTSEGFKTNLTFSNRAAQLPKPEALLNKIRPTF